MQSRIQIPVCAIAVWVSITLGMLVNSEAARALAFGFAGFEVIMAIGFATQRK